MTLTATASVIVIPLIGGVPVISTEFGGRAPVLSFFGPTVSAAKLILATLRVLGVECVIEIENDIVVALSESWMCSGNCAQR